ncbi:MAG: S1/P1 nuclease [Pirellulaceae bacterium]
MHRLQTFIIIWAFSIALNCGPCYSWSECGHHIIAVMAYRQLKPEQQAEVIRLIKAHPRFELDFKIPEGIKNEEEWLVGRAGYWPDVARRSEYDRPTWHYQLGATKVIGEVKDIPDDPGPLPENATLRTQELYASQAYELCNRVLADKNASDADRSVALCWILHVVADIHQPCHAGSLYVAGIFPDGDRWGNQAKQSLHKLIDRAVSSSVANEKFRSGMLSSSSWPSAWTVQ